jgi:RNA-directed DNA polymerase
MLIDDYRLHWVTWVYSGIPSSIINFDYESV